MVLAVPTQQLRAWLTERVDFFRPGVMLVNAAKGLELETLSTCSGIAASALTRVRPRYAVLSGPSFAAEVLEGLPTAVVLASRHRALGQRLREVFAGPTFRCYSSTDVTGVEMWGP